MRAHRSVPAAGRFSASPPTLALVATALAAGLAPLPDAAAGGAGAVAPAAAATPPADAGAGPAAAGVFTVGGISAAPGERASGFLPVPAVADDQTSTALPVTLINGSRPGPTLALIAGTHGAEYAPMIALQRVRRQIDPAALSGRMLLVHVANVPAFFGRTVYYSPVDGKNLNRLYYGDAGGSLSERIAHVVTTEVIDRADYLVDMHAGDGNESLAPYIYLPVSGDDAMDATMRRMALAFGIGHVLLTPLTAQDRERPGYTETAAVFRGVPALTTETGGRGSTDERWVTLAARGVHRLATALGMLEGEVPEPVPVTWLEDAAVVRADTDGMFRASVQAGTMVETGQRLGELTDLFGDQVSEIRAPFPGWVHYVVATPPVSEGEPLVQLSRPIDAASR